MRGGLSLGHQDAGHLVTLPLGTNVGSKTPLEELEGTLVLADAQQLHAALLVRRKANHFTDDVTDELVVL